MSTPYLLVLFLLVTLVAVAWMVPSRFQRSYSLIGWRPPERASIPAYSTPQ